MSKWRLILEDMIGWLIREDIMRAVAGIEIRIEINIPKTDAPQPVQPVEPICHQCGNPASEKSMCDRLDCPYFEVPGFLKHNR
jgi:hypothetical protein